CQVAEANRPLAEAKSQTVTVTTPEELPMLGDADRLCEAVDNLLSNAIKYTPVGGAIRVRTRRSGGTAEITVEDTGPGFSPEDCSRLFGRFQRLSAKPTGGESSTGLGLSIVRRLAELHGGTVVAANREGGGALLTLHLPIGEGDE